MKNEFIKLAIDCNVLRFGEFTLKSGRVSPYFFNAGLFYTGNALQRLGEFYAQTIINNNMKFKHLFGPAYKGLPIATATAIALDQKGIDVSVTFNRKEIKNHGEGGQLIGAPLNGDTIIIDDVITAGTAFRESREIIERNGGIVKGVVIALDRCERGINDNSSAINDIKNQGISVCSIISFFDLIEYLNNIKNFSLANTLIAYHDKFKEL